MALFEWVNRWRPVMAGARGRAGKRIGLMPLVAVLAFALSGCATLQGIDSEIADAEVTPDTAAPIVSGREDARDRALGAREHPKVLASYGGVYRNNRLERYVASVTDRLRRVSDRPDLPFRVTILNSPSINAFSLPGGYVYVTRGLLALANDEAEVAAVIAHEMAHITQRHAIAREEEAVSAAIATQVISDVVDDPRASEAAFVLSQGQLAQFSRRQELEADRIGIRTLGRAGYDPQAAVSFLTSLERQTALHARLLNRAYDSGRVDLFATHPSTPERIAAARQDVQDVLPESGDRERDRGSHMTAINGILYGDDPEEGFVRGETFVHPGLGLTFTMPRGYGLENTAQAVIGFSERGDLIRFDGISLPRGAPLAEYLATEGLQGGRITDVRQERVNGLETAIADAEAPGWNFRIALIRTAPNAAYRFILASRSLSSSTEAAFLQTVRSFRLLTPQESRAVQPLRIAVATVQPGDTEGSLAGRMALDDRALERFLTLNGLGAGSTISPGMQVKLIAN